MVYTRASRRTIEGLRSLVFGLWHTGHSTMWHAGTPFRYREENDVDTDGGA